MAHTQPASIQQPTTQTTELSLLDMVVAATTMIPKKVTKEQKDEVSRLREEAKKLGGSAALLADIKCQPTYQAAEEYITMLRSAIMVIARMTPTNTVTTKEVTVEAPTPRQVIEAAKPTPRQWAYIKHLRQQCWKMGLKLLAKKSVNTRREASNYIKEMLDTLNKGTPKTSNGGTMCCCRVEGCNIGPMVSR